MLNKVYWGVFLLAVFTVGCKNQQSLETAFSVKGRRDEYLEAVSLLKTKGDIVASEINDKLRLYSEKTLSDPERPDPDEIIRLQNELLQLQMKKIREQDNYFDFLERTVINLVDPKKEVFVND